MKFSTKTLCWVCLSGVFLGDDQARFVMWFFGFALMLCLSCDVKKDDDDEARGDKGF